jgi:uracil-DNA glycosylase family 4
MMPAPKPRHYQPHNLGADCNSCPLNCKGKLAVPPLKAKGKPKAIVIGESPDNKSKFDGVAFRGFASQELIKTLEANGLRESEVHFVYRIACEVPRNKRLDKFFRAASKACKQRLLAEMESLDPDGKLPRLYLGKWAPMGIVGSRQFNEQQEISLSRNVMRLNTMVLMHPNVAFRTKPAWRKSYRESLKRFALYCQGKLEWPEWPEDQIFIKPDGNMLDALKAMGPTVAADVETLGVDPLVDPMTAIGISDGELSISVPWCTYDNRHGHHVGIEKSLDPVHLLIKDELKRVLESRRVVGQNFSYDLPALARIGIEVKDPEDTLDASKILDPEIPAGLEELTTRLMPTPSRWKTEFGYVWKGKDSDQGAQFTESPQEALLLYNSADSLATIRCWQILEPLLDEED